MEIGIFNFTSSDELKLWIALSLHLWYLTAGIISMSHCALQHPKFIRWSMLYWKLPSTKTKNKEISTRKSLCGVPSWWCTFWSVWTVWSDLCSVSSRMISGVQPPLSTGEAAIWGSHVLTSIALKLLKLIPKQFIYYVTLNFTIKLHKPVSFFFSWVCIHDFLQISAQMSFAFANCSLFCYW